MRGLEIPPIGPLCVLLFKNLEDRRILERRAEKFPLFFDRGQIKMIFVMVNVLETSLESVGRSLNSEAARKLVELKAPVLLQERIDALADLCGEGLASEDELSEYDSMITAANVIAILQAEARRVLSHEQP